MLKDSRINSRDDEKKHSTADENEIKSKDSGIDQQRDDEVQVELTKHETSGLTHRKTSATQDNAENKQEVKSQNEEVTSSRNDVVLWMFGLLFLFVIGSLMFGLGELKGWDAYSAYNHNMSNSSMERFLSEPFTPEPGVYKRSDKEASSRWYYWKLKPDQVTAGTKIFVWAAYMLHNLSVWLVLYLQHKSKTFLAKGAIKNKYSSDPDKYNLILFMINAAFHVLHLINTHTTYDGTAADVSEASSQSSVIVAIILMLVIEFSERGIFFGYPTKTQLRRFMSSIWMSPAYLIRKFHGYFIYWAAIYTFWYHPMENTPGHFMGFAHTWFFMLQGSLAFTKFHLNKYWRLTLEAWVTIHAGIVAYQTVPSIMGKELWPMFFFGFLTAVFLTQLYGLPVWNDVPSWSRAIPAAVFVVVIVTSYSFIKDTQGQAYTRISEIVRIPGIYYLLLLVGWLIIVASVKLILIMKRRKTASQADTVQNVRQSPPKWKEVVVLCGVVLLYLICVFFSWLFEYLDVPLNLIVFTMLYSTMYLVIAAIGGSLLLQMLIPVRGLV